MAPPTQGAINLLIWTIVFTILDVVFVCLRLFAARLIRRKLHADDYLILFALLNTFGLTGVVIWAVFKSGMGHYMTELSPSELQVAFQVIPAAYVTWTLSTTSFKLSVLFLYVRIFSVKTFKYLSYVLMGLTSAYCISFMVVFLTTCSPDISQLWNPRPDGHCRDLNVGQLGSVSANLGLDILILILPMPFLWKLQMALRNKIVVTVVFSFSFLTIGIMIWRIRDLVANAKEDFVFNLPTLALTTILEMCLCIIIACIPTLAPIVKTYILPVVTKLSGSGRSLPGSRSAPHLNTFARMGKPKRNTYATMDTGSQDPINDEVQFGKHDTGMGNFREQASTRTYIASTNDVELAHMRPTKNAIYVQQQFDTRLSD